MNILKKLFFKSNPQSVEIPKDHLDILLDWFNEEKVDIKKFEEKYYLPITAELRKNNHFLDLLFENKPKEAKNEYWSIISFRYLTAFFPNEKYLYAFLELYSDKKLPYEVSNGLFSDVFFNQIKNIEVKDLRETAILVAKFFYYVNFKEKHKKGDNVSTQEIVSDLSHLVYSNVDLFWHFIKQIQEISIEYLPEKPFMYFSFLKNKTNEKQNFTEEYQQKLNNLLNQATTEYKEHFSMTLEREMFELIYQIYGFIDVYQKGRKKIPAQVLLLIDEKLTDNGKKLSFIRNFIYLSEIDSSLAYCFNEYKGLLSTISQNLILNKKETESLFDQAKALIYSTVFNEVLVPLAKRIENEITFRDSLFVKLEDEMMERRNPLPNPIAFKINTDIIKLQTVKAKTEDEKLQIAYFSHVYSGIYSDITRERNKDHPQVSKLVEYLNLFFPCSLKSITKFYSEEGTFLHLNIDNEIFEISYYQLEEDINNILQQKKIPYRFCQFYLYHKNTYQDCYDMVFSYSFFSKTELAVYHNSFDAHKHVFDFNERLKSKADRHLIDINITYHGLEEETPIYFWDYLQQHSGKQVQEQNFENSVEWQWLKVNYIDEIVENKRAWYELLDFIIPIKQGKKTQKSFIIGLENFVKKIGYDTYFKELKQIFNKMPEDNIWWNNESVKELSKSLMVSCAFLKINYESISILKYLAEFYYGKIYGEGARSVALGNFALDCLVKTNNEEALASLVLMRNKAKYNTFLKALDKYIEIFISESDLEEGELADKGIYNFNFDQNFEKRYQIADYTLTLRFANRKLIKEWRDENNNIIKKLPAEVSVSQTDVLKEINLDIKSIETIFKDLKHRILSYWTEERNWKFSFWKKYIFGNALINANIQNLIWKNETENTSFIIIDNVFLNYDNQEVNINDDALISLWHPVTSNKEMIIKWQDYLWEHSIVQPEKQVYRENYHLSENELTNTSTDFFKHHFLEVNKLMAIANTRAWKFSYVHEGENWPRKYFKKQNLTIHLKADYDRYDFAIPTKELIFTKNDTTKINDYPLVLEPIALGEISPILLSEVFRDIDLFIATASISNNPNLANERQEFQDYYQSYEKSLFSENATSRVRKMILEQLVRYLDLHSSGFDKNYIIINGKKNDYKINLSTGLVQMKDTSKYLNIQPNLASLKKNKKVRLPIEDDETLLIIISKILFIMNNEDEIT